jgi:hypothetical protein
MKVPILKMMLLCLLIGGSGKDCWGQEILATQPTESPKEITVNEETGEILGCKLLKRSYKVSKPTNPVDLVTAIKKIEKSKKLTKKGDRLSGNFTTNKKFFICQDLSHGGYLNAIYFFDSKLKFLSSYKFEKSKIREVKFNTEETFVTVAETDSYDSKEDDFFIFNLSGNLIKKGNFITLTNIKSSNSLDIYVNKNASMFALNRGDCFIFNNKGDNQCTIKGGVNSFGFLSESNLIACNKLGKLQIREINTSKILYESQNTVTNLITKNNQIIFKNNKNQISTYEISNKN